MCQQLQEVHDCEISHNDIKAANIMLYVDDLEAAQFDVAIIDLGMATLRGKYIMLDGEFDPKNHYPPEYFDSLLFSYYGDVYSLGFMFPRFSRRVCWQSEQRCNDLEGLSKWMTSFNWYDRPHLRTVIRHLKSMLDLPTDDGKEQLEMLQEKKYKEYLFAYL